MNTQDFAYWLQGFFELSGATSLNETQVQIIKEHLQLTMVKVTPTSMPTATTSNLPPQVCPNCNGLSYIGNQPCPSCRPASHGLKLVPAETIMHVPTVLSC